MEFLAEPAPPSPTVTVTQLFEEFVAKEVALSNDRPDYLVRPSGSLDAKLGFLLHFPTFKVAVGLVSWGETAEESNPCIACVLRKLLDWKSFLMLDTYNRRASPIPRKQRRKNHMVPMDTWPEDLRRLHEQFAENIMHTSTAKVWVVFGKANKERYLRSAGSKSVKTVDFSQRDPSLKTPVALEFNESRQICRIVIFCQHPETLFYASDSCDTGRLMDQGMNLAAALTDYTVRPQYYADFFDNIRRGQRGHFDSPGFPVVYARTHAPRGVAPRIEPPPRETSASLVRRINELMDEETPDRTVSYHEIGPELTEWLKSQQVVGEAAAEDWRKNSAKGNLSLVAQIHAFAAATQDYAATKHTAAKDEKSKFACMYRRSDQIRGDPATVDVYCGTCGHEKTDRNRHLHWTVGTLSESPPARDVDELDHHQCGQEGP